MKRTKPERLEIYFQRLTEAVPPSGDSSAIELLGRVLEQVEDEFSGEPNDPARWMELDRMFPPQPDNSEPMPGRPGVTHLWSKGHHIYVGVNGSVEFWTRPSRLYPGPSTLVFRRLGADGKGLPS